VVHRHEGERGVEPRVDDRQVEPVACGDRLPEGQPRAAHRVHPDPDAARADGLEIDHIGKIGDVWLDVIILLRRRGAERRRERHPFDLTIPAGQEGVGPRFDGPGFVRVRRTAVGRVVLESAIVGRVVRGRDDDTVGEARRTAHVVGENGERDNRGRRVTVATLDTDLDPIRRENLKGRNARGL
jgi:hypothetical protein